MSTHAHVGLEHSDGHIEYIYVHFDGYPSRGVGSTLLERYVTRDQVTVLVSQGDSSTLGVPYTSRGDDLNIGHAIDRKEFLDSRISVSYTYLFTAEGNWLCSEFGREFHDLSLIVKQ